MDRNKVIDSKSEAKDYDERAHARMAKKILQNKYFKVYGGDRHDYDICKYIDFGIKMARRTANC